MANISYFCVVFAFIFTLGLLSADECIQQGPCRCKFDDYSEIDLTQLIPQDTKFIQDSIGNYTYFFSGCKNQELKPQAYGLNQSKPVLGSLIKCIRNIIQYNITVLKNDTDKGPVPVNVTVVSVQDKCSPLGTENELKYATTNGHQIVYNTSAGKSFPSIRLVCDTFNTTDLKITSYESDMLTLYSPSVCIKHTAHHELSTGSIFCILFFTFSAIYFIGGGIIMYTVRGARGVEVIPNFDFWVSLPGLIRDGTIFILSGCRPFTVATAETYDRI